MDTCLPCKQNVISSGLDQLKSFCASSSSHLLTCRHPAVWPPRWQQPDARQLGGHPPTLLLSAASASSAHSSCCCCCCLAADVDCAPLGRCHQSGSTAAPIINQVNHQPRSHQSGKQVWSQLVVSSYAYNVEALASFLVGSLFVDSRFSASSVQSI